jgi:Zn-dependent protease
MSSTVIGYLATGVALILAITLHELAHGVVAWAFGDDTAKNAGRLSLNPIRHVDPFGTVILPGMLLAFSAPFLFGYAKPVPVQFHRLSAGRLGVIAVAIAGPGMNILLAWLSLVLLHVNLGANTLGNDVLAKSFQFNVILAIFNMLPLLPLDGGRVLSAMLPRSLKVIYDRTEPMGMMILFFFLLILPAILKYGFGINFNLIINILKPMFELVSQFLFRISGHHI